MKKEYCLLAFVALLLTGCLERQQFLLHCNTKGFLKFNDVNMSECRCVADRLDSSLTQDEYTQLIKSLNSGQLEINSKADMVLNDAGRQCVNFIKQ